MSTQHTLWGPSSAARRIACPGSLKAEGDILSAEGGRDSEYALIGTAAHTLAEQLLVQKDTQLQAVDWIGEQIEVGQGENVPELVELDHPQIETTATGYLVTVDREMADNVQQYVDFVNELRVAHDATFSAVEVGLDLSRWLPDNKGTADAVVIRGSTVYVVDFKYGKGVKVHAKNNAQLKLYALGVIDKYGMLYDFDDVVMVIHQPRLGHVDTDERMVDALLSWADNIVVPAYKESMEPDARRAAGDHCRFCLAAPTCRTARDHVEDSIRNEFPVIDGEVKSESGIIPLDIAKMAKEWAAQVEAYAIKRLEAGEEVTDGKQKYKLVHGRGSRVWSAQYDVGHELQKDGIDPFVHKLKSPAQVEKELGRKKFAELAAMVEKKPGKPTLAPESDSRPAIASADAMGFEDIS